MPNAATELARGASSDALTSAWTYAVTDGPTYGLDLSRIIGWIRDP
jgi:hypothetical protein